jgi:lipooligosaccharide transport system permease protein
VKGAVRVIEHELFVFRRTWQGTVLVSFLSPVLFLGAMGVGLGGLVNRASGGVDGVPYLEFLAPGLLATTAMQLGTVLATYPVMAKVRWDRTYEAMLATPLSVGDLVTGDIAFIGLRGLLSSGVFFGVMAVFGIPHGAFSALAIGAGVLTALAFGAPVYAFSTTQENDSGFNALQRFVIIPLFLFAGAFFPITRLPFLLQLVAYATPLYHGVALTRDVTLGRGVVGTDALHAAVLLVYIVAGVGVGFWGLRRRLAT